MTKPTIPNKPEKAKIENNAHRGVTDVLWECTNGAITYSSTCDNTTIKIINKNTSLN